MHQYSRRGTFCCHFVVVVVVVLFFVMPPVLRSWFCEHDSALSSRASRAGARLAADVALPVQ